MKLSINQTELANALSKVERAVATKATLPAVTCIKLQATSGKLQLQATNLTFATSVILEADVQEEGAIIVPKSFAELVSNLRGNLELSTDEKTWTLYVKSGKSRNQMKGIDPTEFPLVPQVSEGVQVSASFLKEGLASVLPQVDMKFDTPIGGVLMAFSGGKLQFAGASQSRFAVCEFPVSGEFLAILPRASANEVVKLLESETCQVSFMSSQVGFKDANVELVTQVVEGLYPDFHGYFQTVPTTTVEVAKDELLSAIKTARVFSREANEILEFDFQGNVLQLIAISAETGSGENEVETVQQGEPVTLYMNGAYVQDALDAIQTVKIRFYLNGYNKPVLITGEDDHFKAVIAPMNIKERSQQADEKEN